MSNVRLDFQPTKPRGTRGILIVLDDRGNTLHSDTLDLANSKQRKQFAQEMNAICEAIAPERVEQAILEKVAGILKHAADDETENKQQADPLEDTPEAVKDAALEVLRSPDLFGQISADIAAIGVAGEDNLALMLYVVMTSRLLDKPLSAVVQGASASGKSFVIETIAKLMPPEALMQAHDVTDQALYYLPSGSLVHRVVVSGERVHEHRGKDGYAEDNTKAFREMVASGELRKAVTIKGPDGKPKTVTIHQPGPIAYIESTTAANIHDEDATRLLPLVTDESAEQTKKIVEAQRLEAKGQTISDMERNEIIQRHHTMQRLLRPLAVRICYIDSISLPETNVATRRTYQQLRYAISSVAFLRQYQKEVQRDQGAGQEYVEADDIDYQVAFRLMDMVLARKYSPLDQQSRDLLRMVQEHVDSEREFTQAECERWSGLSNTTVRRRLSPLTSTGIVSVDATSKPYKYKVAKPELAETADLELPTPEDIAERIAIMSESSYEVVQEPVADVP